MAAIKYPPEARARWGRGIKGQIPGGAPAMRTGGFTYSDRKAAINGKEALLIIEREVKWRCKHLKWSPGPALSSSLVFIFFFHVFKYSIQTTLLSLEVLSGCLYLLAYGRYFSSKSISLLVPLFIFSR